MAIDELIPNDKTGFAYDLTNSELSDFYRKMLRIRRFEEASANLYMQGHIKGFLHLYIGEEAIAVGSISALSSNDYVVTHYRDHGHAIAKGMESKTAMAELCGKSTGSSGGKGGSMHLIDASKKFMGGYAIVAGQMPMAAGIALANQYRGDDSVVLCYFGDGAVNEGAFHETMNLASVCNLPMIFFLENNLYGMGTHADRARAGGAHEIYKAAEAYSMPGVQIDGMQLSTVYNHTREIVEDIRTNGGPRFIEAMCYRYRGHSMADPSMYREREEVEEHRDRDPIDNYRKWLIEDQSFDEKTINDIDTEIETEIESAVKFAMDSPEPEPDTLFENIYV